MKIQFFAELEIKKIQIKKTNIFAFYYFTSSAFNTFVKIKGFFDSF